jgi:hypothetical protein
MPSPRDPDYRQPPPPRERDYRQPLPVSVYREPLPASAYRQPLRLPTPLPSIEPVRVHRHHFHDLPPWPQQHHGDYINVEGWGWWPRWYPYWDERWVAYWWSLYDYYGGDAYPEYAEYMRDAILRQYASQWGLVVSGWGGRGNWMGAEPQRSPIVAPIVRDHRGIVPTHGAPTPLPVTPTPSPGSIVPTHGAPSPWRDDRYGYDRDRYGYGYDRYGYDRYERQRYRHPHDYYGDYVVVEAVWWPRWFPYWDPAWVRFWWQLYYYYGGDAYADYAQYARDAYLRANAAQWGWI